MLLLPLLTAAWAGTHAALPVEGGVVIAVATPQGLDLRDASTGLRLRRVPTAPVRDLVSCGDHVLACTDGGLVRLEPDATVTLQHPSPCTAVAASPERVAVVGEGTVTLLRRADGRLTPEARAEVTVEGEPFVVLEGERAAVSARGWDRLVEVGPWGVSTLATGGPVDGLGVRDGDWVWLTGGRLMDLSRRGLDLEPGATGLNPGPDGAVWILHEGVGVGVLSSRGEILAPTGPGWSALPDSAGCVAVSGGGAWATRACALPDRGNSWLAGDVSGGSWALTAEADQAMEIGGSWSQEPAGAWTQLTLAVPARTADDATKDGSSDLSGREVQTEPDAIPLGPGGTDVALAIPVVPDSTSVPEPNPGLASGPADASEPVSAARRRDDAPDLADPAVFNDAPGGPRISLSVGLARGGSPDDPGQWSPSLALTARGGRLIGWLAGVDSAPTLVYQATETYAVRHVAAVFGGIEIGSQRVRVGGIATASTGIVGGGVRASAWLVSRPRADHGLTVHVVGFRGGAAMASLAWDVRLGRGVLQQGGGS